jgi:gluconokinase
MGVSGCGKTDMGKALAARLGTSFIEGDELHSADAVAKMASGIALNDDDRWPWLDRVGKRLRDAGPGSVTACSALRRRYRERLRQSVGPSLRFVMLEVSRPVLTARISNRPGHFMPLSLLDDQLRVLERPDTEPDALIIPADSDPTDILRQILAALKI